MKRTLTFGAAVAACCVAAAPAWAAAAGYYYDGARKITVTPQKGLVAEFARADAKSAVKRAYPNAVELKAGVGGPRIYKAPAASFKPQTETGTFTSPVFRQGTSPAGRLMALPGGVIVTFKPEWTDAQVLAWVSARGYSVQQRLNIQGHWYVLATPPGQAALDAANTIHESREVLAASPNWWLETVTR